MTTTLAAARFATVDEFFADEVASAGFDATADADMIADVLDEAADIMFTLSDGRVFGVVRTVVRPFMADPIWSGDWIYRNWPTWLQNSRVALSDEDYHDGLRVIPLRGPNTTVHAVKIDGATLVEGTDYTLIDGYKLARMGYIQWPTTNDLTKHDAEKGTFSIDYSFGEIIHTWVVKKANIELAAELAAPYKGRKRHLPAGVTAANIQGASVAVRDHVDALREGDQQLPGLARFVGIFGQRWRPDVWSPELQHGWHFRETALDS